MIDCGNCIHVEMCKWCDEMVKNHTCDWYDECGSYEEPKQGEWKHKTEGLPHFVTIEWFICSNCGVQKSEATLFCPNCGARMVKEGEAE